MALSSGHLHTVYRYEEKVIRGGGQLHNTTETITSMTNVKKQPTTTIHLSFYSLHAICVANVSKRNIEKLKKV